MEEFVKDGIKKMLLQKRSEFQQKLIGAEKSFRAEINLGTQDWNCTKTHTADCCGVLPSVNGTRLTTLRKCLRKFDETMKKVEKGTYGVCEECGEQIPLGRLALVPFTRYCVPCKKSFNSSLSIGRVSA